MSLTNRTTAQGLIKADRNLSTGARLLLFHIGDLVDDGRLLEAGCDYLAEELGASRSGVQRWRAELVDRGYLIPERSVRGGQDGNTYRLPWDSTAHIRAVQPPTNRPPAGGTTAHQPPARGREQEQERNRNRAGDTSPLDPEICEHIPVDGDGYCTACKTEITIEVASA